MLSDARLVVPVLLLAACQPRAETDLQCGTEGALARCLTPKQSTSYYADQSNRYFDSIDLTASRDSKPTYAEQVARWEWPPWLKLTAFGRENIEQIDAALVQGTPAPVVNRDCRGFSVQPFGRCRVSFSYPSGPCPIYEEFTFNDQGEMTFVEAWSDLPGLRPMSDSDQWGEQEVRRLSTIVPGLGTSTGAINLDGTAMQRAAAQDANVADFAVRARDFWPTWTAELQGAGSDLYARGCGWSADAGSP